MKRGPSLERGRRGLGCASLKQRNDAIFSFRRSRGSHGFSLIELLMTIVIIVVLITLFWSSTGTNRNQALRQACQKNLQRVYLGLESFAGDHASKFPTVAGARTSAEALDLLVPRYTSDTASFLCPGSSDRALPAAQSIRSRTISYAYYMGRSSTNAQVLMSDRQVDTTAKAAHEAAFSSDGKSPGNNHGKLGGNLLFCDGHTDLCPARPPFALTINAGEVLLNP